VSLASLVALSAGLTVLSLPAFDLGFLAWIALAPLLLALRLGSVVAAAGLGLLFGFVFAVGSFWWLHAIPNITVVRFIVLGIAVGVFYMAFSVLYRLASARLAGSMLLVGPALWVALEYARGNLAFLALPWNFVGHSQHRYLSIIQIVDVTGVYGVSFVVVMVNELLSRARELGHDHRWRVPLSAVTLVMTITVVYGVYRLAQRPEPVSHIRVAIIQPNLPVHGGMSPREQGLHLAAYERLTKQAAARGPALTIWPSASLPAPLTSPGVRLYVGDVARRSSTHLLVGGAGGEKLAPARPGMVPYSNSEVLLSPSGAVEGQYNKMRLTPFTETVPLQGVVRWPRWVTTVQKGFTPGGDHTIFRVHAARFGTPICWESAFPTLFRRFVRDGANMMVSVTNEGAFGDSAGPHQALAMVVFRAVENRVAIARAATTGVSAIIDARGRMVAKVLDARNRDIFVPGVLVHDLPLFEAKTFYTVHGDVFAGLAIVLAAIAMAITVVRAAPSRLLVTVRAQDGHSAEAPQP
jgi:apolipoprotein N-acyltransferase